LAQPSEEAEQGVGEAADELQSLGLAEEARGLRKLQVKIGAAQSPAEWEAVERGYRIPTSKATSPRRAVHQPPAKQRRQQSQESREATRASEECREPGWHRRAQEIYPMGTNLQHSIASNTMEGTFERFGPGHGSGGTWLYNSSARPRSPGRGVRIAESLPRPCSPGRGVCIAESLPVDTYDRIAVLAALKWETRAELGMGNVPSLLHSCYAHPAVGVQGVNRGYRELPASAAVVPPPLPPPPPPPPPAVVVLPPPPTVVVLPPPPPPPKPVANPHGVRPGHQSTTMIQDPFAMLSISL